MDARRSGFGLFSQGSEGLAGGLLSGLRHLTSGASSTECSFDPSSAAGCGKSPNSASVPLGVVGSDRERYLPRAGEVNDRTSAVKQALQRGIIKM